LAIFSYIARASHDVAFVTDQPRIHHREHRIAQIPEEIVAALFTFFDQHEDLMSRDCNIPVVKIRLWAPAIIVPRQTAARASDER